jgi:hypothetical protein
MISLKKSISEIGEPKKQPFSWRESFADRTPPSLKRSIIGMKDPQVAQWKLIDNIHPEGENEWYSDEAQGITTDGHYWYISTNATGPFGALKAIVKFPFNSISPVADIK